MLSPRHILLAILLVTSTAAAPLRHGQRLAQSQVAASSNGGPGMTDGASATDLSSRPLDDAQDGETGGATARLDRRMSPVQHPYRQKPTQMPPSGQQPQKADDQWGENPLEGYSPPNDGDDKYLASTVTVKGDRALQKISADIQAKMRPSGNVPGETGYQDYGDWRDGSSSTPSGRPAAPPKVPSAGQAANTGTGDSKKGWRNWIPGRKKKQPNTGTADSKKGWRNWIPTRTKKQPNKG